MNRWLGAEIIFVQVGHGLLGALAIWIIAWHVPWWLTLALTPLILFSLAYWLMEARIVVPVARQLLRGEGAPRQTRGMESKMMRGEKDD